MKTEKLLSLAGAALIPLPLLLTALAGAYGAVLTPYAIPWLLAGLSAMALGTAAGRLTASAKGKWVYVVKLVSFLLGALCVAACITAVFIRRMNSLVYIFMPLAVYLWYFFGLKNGKGRVLLNNMSLGGYCAEAALLFPLCDSACNDSFVLLIISAFVMIIGMVTINLRQLQRLSFRGKNGKTVISGASVKYNLKLTLIFAALILVPFFFANWGAEWLWELVKIIVRFLLSLFSFSTENIEGGEAAANPFIPQISGEGNNLWLKILAAIIVAAGIILAAKPFIKAVKNLIKRLGEALGKKTETRAEEAFYTDYYGESKCKEKEKSFKKAYRAFLREKEPERKYRLGYKAFMIRLGERGAELAPSDTTAYHRDAGKAAGAPELADTVIDKYERVRYKDEETKPDDCEILDKVLKEFGKRR